MMRFGNYLLLLLIALVLLTAAFIPTGVDSARPIVAIGT